MATQETRDYSQGFGQVSRTVGLLFRYLLLAATLVGLVMLAILLVYVTNDAIQPLTADPGWHLTFLLTVVIPTLGVGGYLWIRNQSALWYGLSIVGFLVVSLMFASGMAMVVVDIVPPLVGFAYVLAIAVPTVAVVAIQRVDRRVPFLGQFLATVLLFYLSLFGVPGPIGTTLGGSRVLPSLATVVQTVPFIPTDWLMTTLVLGGVSAGTIGFYAARIRGRTTGILAASLVLIGTSVAAFIGPLVGLTPVPATVLAAVAIAPTVAYVGGATVTNPERQAGLVLAGVILGGCALGVIVVDLFAFAGPQSWVDWQFLTSPHSRTAENAGLYPAIGGSILLMVTVAALSFPLGVGSAVYLEEYAPDNRLTRLIDVNISNLAGVPSVVYGLLGLGVFVTYIGRPAGTVLVGGATLALLILPIVIISSREAIRSVPDDMREASYGMGATRWQTVRNVVLPRSFPGILTGTILALGRAIGETAPLIMIGSPDVLFVLPTELSSKVSAMPLQVYAWASLFAGPDFYQKAVPAGVVVLVSVLLAMNSVAIVLRNKYQRDQ